MHGGIILHDQTGLGQLRAISIEASDDKLRLDRAVGHIRLKIAAQVEKAQHIQPWRGSSWQRERLLRRLPGVRNTRRQREASFIEVNEIEIIVAVSASLTQLGQMLFGRAKVFLLAQGFQAVAHPLPGIARCLECSFERVGADRFPQFFFYLLTNRFQRARRLRDEVKDFFLLRDRPTWRGDHFSGHRSSRRICGLPTNPTKD